MLVTLLVPLNQEKLLSMNLNHELEPAHGDQTACEGLVDKTNYCKADWDVLNLSTLDIFKV